MKQPTITQQGKPLVNVLTGLTNSEEKVNTLYRTLDKAWKTSFKLEQKGIISSEVMAGLEDAMNALRKQFSK